jgi:hypothetical protein
VRTMIVTAMPIDVTHLPSPTYIYNGQHAIAARSVLRETLENVKEHVVGQYVNNHGWLY